MKGPPDAALATLVRRSLAPEDEDTARLVRALRPARRRGYFTKGELVAVCRWKSARAIHHVRANTHHLIRAATAAALATRSERRRVEALLQLKGVSLPMASAVLTLLNPRRYGVIDIRVWQLLHDRGAVRANRQGEKFSVAQWLQFLAVLRRLSSALGLTVRDVEHALFDAHRAAQVGRLYDRRRSAAR